MKKRLRSFSNVVVVDDAATIRTLNADENVDRQFKLHNSLNRFIIKRVLQSFTYNGTRFPHMLPRNDEVRIARHSLLWDSFNTRAAAIAAGANELEPIARWIRHETPGMEPGVLTQQIIGQFFNPAFHATPESWKAAVIFHEDATATNLPKIIWWKFLGKARKAKKLLASTVNNDIIAMHGIGVAIHNLVASIHLLRSIYEEPDKRKTLTPEEAVDLSLSAPRVVLRQALNKGVANGCPYSRFTLFMLKLKEANHDQNAKDLIFMSNSWSRCPAENWIHAVIAGIWNRVMLLEQHTHFG
jgi:hypothetical protein